MGSTSCEGKRSTGTAICHRSDCQECSSQDGVGDRGAPGPKEEDSGEAGGLEPVVAVVLEGAVYDRHLSGAVVADEEDRPAAFVCAAIHKQAAINRERHPIPVVVYRAAAAATRSAVLGGVGADADGAVGEETAVQHRPGHADAAQRAAVAAHVACEAAVDDVHGKAVVLRQRPDGSTSDVRSIALAPVAGEHGVDDPQ